MEYSYPVSFVTKNSEIINSNIERQVLEIEVRAF